MQLTRRNFLRTALLAPIAAAAAPLVGQSATREYVRFKVATMDSRIVGQIMVMVNMTVQNPRTMVMMTEITD